MEVLTGEEDMEFMTRERSIELVGRIESGEALGIVGGVSAGVSDEYFSEEA